jgi:uncharacterized PurR-regulated membrane protein YhhQ (DUF165 family)
MITYIFIRTNKTLSTLFSTEIDNQIYLYCIFITETTAPLYWHHTNELAVDRQLSHVTFIIVCISANNSFIGNFSLILPHFHCP